MGQVWSLKSAPETTVIIPTFNEAENIATTISSVRRRSAKPVNVIVSDGFSTDDTIRIARKHGAKVMKVSGGRARQQNMAAKKVNTKYMLFLHADTIVPELYDMEISRVLTQPGVNAGAFRLSIDHQNNNKLLKMVTYFANLRSIILQRPYGDQGLFFNTKQFFKIGAFNDHMPFLEDYEITTRVTRNGNKISIADSAVVTSARRWNTIGVIPTTILNQAVILAYHCGVPVTTLRNWYKGALVRATKLREHRWRQSTLCSTPTQC